MPKLVKENSGSLGSLDPMPNIAKHKLRDMNPLRDRVGNNKREQIF